MLTPEKLRESDGRTAIKLPNGEWHKRPSDLGELALFLATWEAAWSLPVL